MSRFVFLPIASLEQTKYTRCMNSIIMYILILSPIFFILAILSFLIRGKRIINKTNTYSYHKKTFLLTKPEHDFYKVLESLLDNKYYIFPQTHLSSLLNHKIVGQSWKGALSHIDRKSVDYVICDKTYLSPLLVIELDDASHSRNDRRDRDKEVERIFEYSNLSLIRIPYAEIANVEKIKSLINKTIGL